MTSFLVVTFKPPNGVVRVLRVNAPLSESFWQYMKMSGAWRMICHIFIWNMATSSGCRNDCMLCKVNYHVWFQDCTSAFLYTVKCRHWRWRNKNGNRDNLHNQTLEKDIYNKFPSSNNKNKEFFACRMLSIAFLMFSVGREGVHWKQMGERK